MNDSYYFRTSDPDYIRHAPSMLEILSKAFPTIITQQESEYELQRLNHLLNKLKGSNRCYNIIAQKLRQCRNGSILSLLVIQCALGLLTIPFSAQHMDGSEMMKLVGWAQSVVTFHGGASQHLDGVAFIFRLHLVLGMTLFLLFPFSRLVHIWSVPVEYLTRKYQLVRARH